MLFKVDTLFGHVIEDTDDGPVYRDDRSKVDGANLRSCKGCGACPNQGGHDPCIVNLPDTLNACCGHGLEETPVSKSLPGYVALRDGRTMRFSGTVGGEAIRHAVDLALEGKDLPDGFAFDAERMWWHGLSEAQIQYVHEYTKQAIFERVRAATENRLPAEDYLTDEEAVWWTGLTDDEKSLVWTSMSSMMPELVEAALLNA